MKLKAILFDLDGTLLPMDQDLFIRSYFGSLAKKMSSHGYETEAFIAAVWESTKCMIKNTGEKTNEDVFWDKFVEIYGEKARNDINLHKDYYENDFDALKQVCGNTPKSNQLIKYLKEKGLIVALATNPVFPQIATGKRMEWAGLDRNDFDLVTTYENSHYCKPNPDYYVEILEKLGIKPEECLMVGNDVTEDMIASILGIKVFLLTDCLINSKNDDISKYIHGSFNELYEYIDKIL